MSQLQTITYPELSGFLDDNSPLIIDLRDQASHQAGHLEGSRQLSESELSRLLRRGDKQQPVLLYCYHGNQSEITGQMFIDFGFSRVYHLAGGYQPAPPVTTSNPPDDENLLAWLDTNGFTGNDINSENNDGQTPLIRACQQGNVTLAKNLLEAGADVARTDRHGNSALWAACYSDNTELLDLLLEHGDDINRQNQNGATCLIYAASASKVAIVEKLLQRNADPTLLTDDGFSALDLCVDRRCYRLLRPPRSNN